MSKNGLHLITPTSISSTGTGNSSSISANGSVTFSTCATLSLNGVFSADYDNYMVVCHQSQNFADNARIRLRAGGTDANSNYVQQTLYANGTSITAGRGASDANLVYLPYATQRTGFVLSMYGPYLAQPTVTRSVTVGDNTSADLYDVAVTHSLSTQYDGFTFFPQSGGVTISGRIAVYGLRK